MDQNQQISTYRCDLLNLLKKARVSPEVDKVSDGGKNINDSCILDLQWHVIAKSENS